MTRTARKREPEELATYRTLGNIRPGAWFLGEYKDDERGIYRMWTQVRVVMYGVQLATRRKFVRLIGTCTDGEPAEKYGFRVESVLSVTALQGLRCGLTIEHAEDTEGGCDG